MSEKEEWSWDKSTGQMGFKAPNEKPENYFPELTTYVCLFTNLPPYVGGKK